MTWELNFLEWLTRATTMPSLNWLSWILDVFSLSCDKGLIWLLAAFPMLFFKKWRKTGIVLLFGIVVFALLFNNVIVKYSFQRPRPFEVGEIGEILFERVSNWMLPSGTGFLGFFEVPDSYSFMSGHSFTSALCATIIFAYHRKTGIVAIVVAAIIAFSRLYFGVHYPTDVIAGVVFGAGFGILSVFLAHKFYNKIAAWFIKVFQKKPKATT